MRITSELLDIEIAKISNQVETAKARANNLAGALVVLQDLRAYLDLAEEKTADEKQAEQEFISDENAEIQARDQALQAASEEAKNQQPDYSFDYLDAYFYGG